MATVEFRGATRMYPGSAEPAVHALDLQIADGEFLVLVGPSGCGKSTSLRMLAGLEEVDAGSIHIGEREVTRVPPKSRDIAMVFQNYALYPHMSVGQNMGFALKMAGVSKPEIAQRVAEAARILDLERYLARYPRALSGGQRQRVAMGRAIVRQPRVFCMDEPLSNLDAKLRVSTRTQIASLQRRLGVTTVYVTHDQVEAMTMGDRVAVLKDGVLQQVGTPRAIYDRPANAFVAGFIGSPPMNLLDVELDGDVLHLGDTALRLPRPTVPHRGPVRVGIRPEDLRPAQPGTGFAMEIALVEELGADSYVYGTTTIGHTSREIVARLRGRAPSRGERIHLTLSSENLHLFAEGTGERLAG